MKFRIHDSNDENDWFDVEGESVEEIRPICIAKVEQLGWENPWSEKIEA